MIELQKDKYKRILVESILVIMILFVFGKINYAENVELTLLPYNSSLSEDTYGTESNPYMLSSVEDCINLQEYSKFNTCENMYFQVDDELTKKEYYYTPGVSDDDDESEMGTVKYNLNLANIVTSDATYSFIGFGSDLKFPFMGKIDFRGIRLRMDTNLICFMGSGATVKNVYINGTITNKKNVVLYGANANIASVASVIYPTKNGNGTDININNVWISDASIIGGTASAGGIAGKVYLNADNVSINIGDCDMSADIAITGNGSGNYNLVISNAPGYVGGLIGDVTSYGGSKYYAYINISGYNKLSGSYSNLKYGAGGIIGHLNSKIYVNLNGTTDFSDMTGMTAAYANVLKAYLVGSEAYSIINQSASYNVIMPTDTSVFANLADVHLEQNSNVSRCSGVIYKDINIDSSTAKVEGDGSGENPYQIKSSNDLSVI